MISKSYRLEEFFAAIKDKGLAEVQVAAGQEYAEAKSRVGRGKVAIAKAVQSGLGNYY